MFPGSKGGRCVRLTILPPSCAFDVKSGNLNFLETYGPLQACNGTALPFTKSTWIFGNKSASICIQPYFFKIIIIIITTTNMLKIKGSQLHAHRTQSINKTRTPQHADQHIVQCINLAR